ncbi:hypothetical protein CDD83_3598 [Cordyceps sp. RAO-2017]|nr:hypothetical protein CDD83_3598 [Cordyceps sp. RAO-2017]
MRTRYFISHVNSFQKGFQQLARASWSGVHITVNSVGEYAIGSRVPPIEASTIGTKHPCSASSKSRTQSGRRLAPRQLIDAGEADLSPCRRPALQAASAWQSGQPLCIRQKAPLAVAGYTGPAIDQRPLSLPDRQSTGWAATQARTTRASRVSIEGGASAIEELQRRHPGEGNFGCAWVQVGETSAEGGERGSADIERGNEAPPLRLVKGLGDVSRGERGPGCGEEVRPAERDEAEGSAASVRW